MGAKLSVTEHVKDAFFDAVERGSVSDVKEMIAKYDKSLLKSTTDGIERYFYEHDGYMMGYNALHRSALRGTLEMTKFLVEKHGFDILDIGREGGSPPTNLCTKICCFQRITSKIRTYGRTQCECFQHLKNRFLR